MKKNSDQQLSTHPISFNSSCPPPLHCPLCATKKNLRLIFSGTHQLFQCCNCRLIFSNRIAEANFFDYYKNDKGKFYGKPYFQVGLGSKNPDYPNYVHALSLTRHLLNNVSANLLDVGCGRGDLIGVAQKLGFHAEGLEVNCDETAQKNQCFKIYFYNGQPNNLPKIGPFDVIVLWDVLEHLPDPIDYLNQIRELLKSNGLLLIRTVNEGCLLSTASLWLYRLSGGALKWPAQRMHESYHVIYFIQETLNLCLEKSGFKVHERWLGEFPAERATSSKSIQLLLKTIYAVEEALGRTFEQYVIAAIKPR